MSKGYLVARAVVTDPKKWGEYVDRSNLAITMYGGKPLVRGGRYSQMEGDGAPRNIVIEFESYDAALRYANSKEYNEAKVIRDGAGTMHMTIVEGV